MFALEEVTTAPPPTSKAELYARMPKAGSIEPAFSISDKTRRERAFIEWRASLPSVELCPHGECLEITYCEECEGPYRSRY